MRTGDHDPFLPVQDGCQAFRAAHAGNIQLARCRQGRIVRPDGTGINDNFRIGNGVCGMRAGERQPQALKPFGLCAGHPVTAAHPVPHFHQHERQAGHA